MKGGGPELGGDVPRCGNCDAFLRNKDLTVKLGFPAQGWCRANPPALVQAILQGPNGQPVPGYQGMFVPTASDCWCRLWHRAGQVIEHEAGDARPAA